MLRKEPDGFLAFLNNEALGEVRFPCSLYGLCGDLYSAEEENATEQLRKRLCSELSIVSTPGRLYRSAPAAKALP